MFDEKVNDITKVYGSADDFPYLETQAIKVSLYSRCT